MAWCHSECRWNRRWRQTKSAGRKRRGRKEQHPLRERVHFLGFGSCNVRLLLHHDFRSYPSSRSAPPRFRSGFGTRLGTPHERPLLAEYPIRVTPKLHRCAAISFRQSTLADLQNSTICRSLLTPIASSIHPPAPAPAAARYQRLLEF